MLKKVGEAKQANEEAEICEKLQLVYAEYQSKNYKSNDILQSLENYFGENNVSNIYINSNKLRVKIKEDFYEYNVTTGKVEKSEPRIGDLVTKVNYGDYIDLGKSIIGTEITTDDWRILYNDKNGNVYAILADYLQNSNESIVNAGFNNDKSSTYNVFSSISRDNLLERFNNTEAWKTLIPPDLRDKCQVRGAITAEILLESYNETYGTNIAYTSTPYLYIDNDSSKGIDAFYISHPSTGEKCLGYWLASPNANDDNRIWTVNYAGRVGRDAYNANYNNEGIAVRPVVSLPSDMQVTKITSNGKTTWTVVQ